MTSAFRSEIRVMAPADTDTENDIATSVSTSVDMSEKQHEFGMDHRSAAFVTMGGGLGPTIFRFGVNLRDPKNWQMVTDVANDRGSATIKVTNNQKMPEAPLRLRLDNSEASTGRCVVPRLQGT